MILEHPVPRHAIECRCPDPNGASHRRSSKPAGGVEHGRECKYVRVSRRRCLIDGREWTRIVRGGHVGEHEEGSGDVYVGEE